MKLAVIGTGISGLSAAWLLRDQHNLILFEKSHRLGGHTNTRVVVDPGGELAIDTGFIVHNDRNYPRLLALFELLGVETQGSDMSFSASINDGHVEYAGDALFAQKTNLISPRHWRMLADIMRFNRLGKQALEDQSAHGQSLGAWLDAHRFSAVFADRYLLPMAASIWSSPSQSIRLFSASALLEFFNNHGLLDLSNRPHWRTVIGGSRRYIEAMAPDLGGQVHLNRGVAKVIRDSDGVEVIDQAGHREHFDGVIFASHADSTLAMLSDADEAERALLGAFSYRSNHALLHSDPALMPVRKRAWASWNYLAQSSEVQSDVSISYWMNRLQRLNATRDYFVTLNPLQAPNPDLVHYETQYTHPVFNQKTREAQASMGLLQGHRHCWYCGAWMGYGFHEDGLGAAIEAVASIGTKLPASIEQARTYSAPYVNNRKPWAGSGGHLING